MLSGWTLFFFGLAVGSLVTYCMFRREIELEA